jgi:hypothetical protein
MTPWAPVAVRPLACGCLMLALVLGGCSGPAAEPPPPPPAANGAPTANDSSEPPPPTFTAEGTLEVTPGETGDDVPSADVLLAEHLLGLKDKRILAMALARMGDGQASYIGSDAAERLAEDVRVKAEPSTLTVRASLQGPSATDVAAVLREVLATYVAEFSRAPAAALETQRLQLETASEFLQEQAGLMATEMVRLRRESPSIDDTPDPETRLATYLKQQDGIRASLAEAQTISATLDQALQQARRQGDWTPVLQARPEIAEALRTDPSLLAITEEVAGLQQLLDGLRSGGGEADEVARAAAALQNAQDALLIRRSELMQQVIQQMTTLLATRIGNLRALEAAEAQRVIEARQVAQASADFKTIEQEHRAISVRLAEVKTGLERLKAAAVLKRPQVRVTRWPEVPTQPDPPPSPPK